MNELFPRGIQPYLLGGLLIGAGSGLIFLLTGRIAGLSGFLTAAQSWWSRHPFFQRPHVIDERNWKTIFVVAVPLGALVFVLTLGGEAFVTGVQWWRLLIGGIFVGLGTRIARGCTSGHGICGLSAFSAPSLVSTVTFMGVAIVTAWILSSAGVTP